MHYTPVVLHYMAKVADGPFNTGPLVAAGFALSEGGSFAIACNKAATHIGDKLRATGEAHLVNCPKCRATPEWQAAEDKQHPSVADDAVPEEVKQMLADVAARREKAAQKG